MLKDLVAKKQIALWAVACLAAPAAMAQPTISSTFDSDLEGWTAVGFEVETNPLAILGGAQVFTQTNNAADMVHDSGGDLDAGFVGNPDGFARFTDVIEQPASFAQAPGAYLGDLTPYLGGTFSFEHRLFAEGLNDDGIGPYTIVFISGNVEDVVFGNLNLNAYGVVVPGPAAADTGWVEVSVELSNAELSPVVDLDLGIIDPSFAGQTASDFGVTTTATLEEVLGNVTQVLVSFELVDNNSTQVSEAGGIDNVRLEAIPEPSSVVLLGLGGLALVRRRRQA